MAKVHFKVSARAGKLLGRENFSNPEGALIELVKNCYDADAKQCVVLYDIPTIKKTDNDGKEFLLPLMEKSSIYIFDNGDGMTEDIILNQWMKIGTGNKEKQFISSKKRIKTGAKGIGRFALDRLGYETEMWTIPSSSKDSKGFYWNMKWNQFDNDDKTISDIQADLSEEIIVFDNIFKDLFQSPILQKLRKEIDFSHGTFIKISNLKDEWFSSSIEDVFKSLEALIPPRELNISFDVYFTHFQDIKNYGKVDTAFFNDFDYKLVAKYDADKLTVNFDVTRNELDIKTLKKNYLKAFDNSIYPYDIKTIEAKTFSFPKSVDKILKWKLTDSNKILLKSVGSFDMTLFYLKFNVSKKEEYPYKSVDPIERKAVLDKFGGVKIYRDSFRVRPYGEPTNDWLRLGARVAQSPAGAGQRVGDWRVRPEQTAGIITISRKLNPLLIDKSDRGALQENEAFEAFKSIIVGIIHEFEFDRSKILNPIYRFNVGIKDEKKQKEIETRAVELANKISAVRKKNEEAFGSKFINQGDLFQKEKDAHEIKALESEIKKTITEIQDEIENQELEEISQVRSLAALGLIVSSFAHELKEIRNNATEINSLEKIFKKIVPDNLRESIDYTDGIDIIDLLKDNSEKIIHWVDYSLNSIQKDKRKRTKIDLVIYFLSLNKHWSRLFINRDITLIVENNIKDLKYDLRIFEMDLDTIFINLINNSIESFNNLKQIQERKISINYTLVKDQIEMIYSDNGIGLSEVFSDKDEIFLPFVTSKKDRLGNNIGTGLGMYLVKKTINDNGGDVEILEPKKGFAIKIILPTRKLLAK